MKRIFLGLAALLALAAAYFFMPSILPDGQQVKPVQSLEVDPDDRPHGMLWVEGGAFSMGSNDDLANADEQPAHLVKVDGYWIDEHEVTVAAFDSFVRATGYKTEAEIPRSAGQWQACWPAATPFDAKAANTAGSFIATASGDTKHWQWTQGASWRHPLGPASTAQPTHPVQHISWNDAIAYCAWQGSRLPSEAEWEYAALAGRDSMRSAWGKNTPEKPAAAVALSAVQPVKSFAANPWRLYDLDGNVAEWCGDWYDARYYKGMGNAVAVQNPLGPSADSSKQLTKRVLKGGDYLAAGPDFSSCRPSARSAMHPSFSGSTTGFRTIMTAPMWEAKKVLSKLKKQD